MLAAAHAAGEARCGHAFNTVTTSTEARLAHHQQAQTREGVERPIITLPLQPSQPALPHGKAAEQQPCPGPLPLALSGAPAQDLLLPPLPGGQSAASSPATPPAVEVPLSATASPPSVSHTHAAAAAAAPAPNPPAPQQRPAATATTAPAAAASAAAAALSSTKRRLEGSLLLSQLLPLSASLSVALAAGDVSRMHAVLALLQSVPVTGQLLWASQVAKPVRGVLQQQAQLRTAQLQQAHQAQQQQAQQQRQQTQQQQQSGLLEDVLSTAGALLRRWKALLEAEMAACDEYRTLRAYQLLRARKQKLQRAKSGGAAAAAAAAAEHTAAQQCDSEHRGTAAPQRKRTYSEHLQQQQQEGQQVAPTDDAACPARPPQPHNKQRYFHALPHSEQRQAQAQTAQVQRAGSTGVAGGTVACQPVTSAGSSLGRVSSGPGPLLAPNSSNFSLAGAPDGSAGDLPELAGMEWEDVPLPEFGAAAAAAADAAIGAGCVSVGIGGDEGSWGVGEEEEGELLVDRPAPLQGQGQDAAAFVL